MSMRKAKTLPQELMIEILSRLPAKSIGRCRCLSKQWLNLLSDPQFIKTHLDIHARDDEEEKLIWICGSHCLHASTISGSQALRISSLSNRQYQIGVLPISRKLNFHHLSDNWASVIGSCNGLVLAENEERILFLINPTTLKYCIIPNFHLALPTDNSFSMSGLGYDSTTDDYKVVTLSEYDDRVVTLSEDDDTSDNNGIFVDVYYVREGLWRRLGSLPHDYTIEEPASGVLVNGALHWFAAKISDHSLVIVALDLSCEEFFELPLPTTLDKDSLTFRKLTASKGCLCMFTGTETYKVDVWTMKEYGVEKSWIKFSFIVPNSLSVPLNSMREDGVALNVYGDWVIYTRVDQGSNMTVAESRGAVSFMESLVNPTPSNGM